MILLFNVDILPNNLCIECISCVPHKMVYDIISTRYKLNSASPKIDSCGTPKFECTNFEKSLSWPVQNACDCKDSIKTSMKE